MPAGRGRPRGSGEVFTTPGIRLTQDELLPFKIGYDLADTIPTPGPGEAADLDPMFAAMTTTERRDLLRLDPDHKRCWLMIGAMYRALFDSIDKARGL